MVDIIIPRSAKTTDFYTISGARYRARASDANRTIAADEKIRGVLMLNHKGWPVRGRKRG